ncbi:MAG: NfeD family protein [Acidimicrobiales bacterium]
MLIGATPAGAQEPQRRYIDVLEVSGLIDPIQVASINAHLDRAESEGATAVIIQLNSPGATVGTDEFVELLDRIDSSPVLVAVWVGQAGSDALGASALLASAADVSGIAPGSRIGDVGDDLDIDLPAPFDSYVDRSAEDVAAIEAGMVDAFAPTIGDMVLYLEDANLTDTLSEIADPDAEVPQRQLLDDVTVRFSSLGLLDQLMHTVASPPVAYLLLLIGLMMILLDFYTAGIGVAGVVGAVSLLLSSYGLGVLGASPTGLILLIVASLAFAIDIQTGVPRFWTAVGCITLVVGTFTLLPGYGIGWLPVLSGIGLTVAFVLSGMPALVRTRFSTTTIGREWMIGLMGKAVSSIDPEGVVEVRDAKWRARTNRLTPIGEGDVARVVAIHGTILEVEPETGGARDYREMRNKS